jgi:hypothetical protein
MLINSLYYESFKKYLDNNNKYGTMSYSGFIIH